MENKSKGFGKYIKSKNYNPKETLSKVLPEIDDFTVTLYNCPDRNKILKDFPFLKNIPVGNKITVVNNETGYTFSIMKLF
ncbi:hypothetical protein [Altericista sp. CCNU0014]|uniref:hypothetical protein n=1 Tax=Altericista sp. CCNU0014 TaxID=3082949 RepID=UPI00384C317C